MPTFPFVPRLDGRYLCLGSYNAGSGKTEWTLPTTDQLVDTIVFSDDFPSIAGFIGGVPEIMPGSPTVVKSDGDFSGGWVMIGRRFEASITLSRPYVRDQNGNADVHAAVFVKRLGALHKGTGSYTIRAEFEAPPTRADRTKDFELTPNGNGVVLPQTVGSLRAWITGGQRTAEYSIENHTPFPSTIVATEWLLDAETRRN